MLASGCSGAIEIALNALVDRGDNILIPRPGFSLYKCICGSRGIEGRSYKLIVSLYKLKILGLRYCLRLKTVIIKF